MGVRERSLRLPVFLTFSLSNQLRVLLFPTERIDARGRKSRIVVEHVNYGYISLILIILCFDVLAIK